MRLDETHLLVGKVKLKLTTTMKRYVCTMNDGEFCQDFHQLKDAKAYRMKENFNYISRYVRIYDRKKGQYIC